MKQINARLPDRMAAEFALCCQLDKHSQQDTVRDLLAAFIHVCRRNNSLEDIPTADLMTDTPKPTESTI